jgi:hypothetical protein
MQPYEPVCGPKRRWRSKIEDRRGADPRYHIFYLDKMRDAFNERDVAASAFKRLYLNDPLNVPLA